MNKYTLLLIMAIVGFLFSSSIAFAGPADEVSAEELLIGGTTGPAITIGLSPRVVGAYFTNGATPGTAQWFTIGAAHPGGNNLYATAQNLTNNYSKAFTPGTEINKALFGLPSGPDSAVDWSTNGWK